MAEKIISFQTAKLSKEKGFPQDLSNNGWYNRVGRHLGIVNLNEKGEEVYYAWDLYQKDTSVKVTKEEYKECCSHRYSAPTQSSLQEWLWDVYSIHVSVIPLKRRNERQIYFQYRIIDFREIHDEDEVMFEHQYNGSFDEFTNPTEAWENGLQEALELLKQ